MIDQKEVEKPKAGIMNNISNFIRRNSRLNLLEGQVFNHKNFFGKKKDPEPKQEKVDNSEYLKNKQELMKSQLTEKVIPKKIVKNKDKSKIKIETKNNDSSFSASPVSIKMIEQMFNVI